MNCELCSKEVETTKLIHMDDYNLEAHVCADCFDRINSAYLKEEKAPIQTVIEKANNALHYVDASGNQIPDFVPKFVITENKISHFFGLQQYKRAIDNGERYFYHALEIYPEATSHQTFYETSYAFNIFAYETKSQSDDRRLAAYEAIKEKMAKLIANKADDQNGLVVITTDDAGTGVIVNGEKKDAKDFLESFNHCEGFTLHYEIEDDYAPAASSHAIYFPEVIEEDTFYNELFDIVISFSSIENFIPLDNVQKFALFYRKLLKKFRYYAQLRPDEASLSGLMMIDLLKPIESDDQYFIKVCIHELQEILRQL